MKPQTVIRNLFLLAIAGLLIGAGVDALFERVLSHPAPIAISILEAAGGIVLLIPAAFLLVYRPLMSEILTRREAEEDFRLLFEASPNAILVIVDTQGTIVLVNRRLEAIFGYHPDELIGKSIEILVPEWFRARHVEPRDRFIAAPTTRRLGAGRDLSGRHKDGHEIPVEICLTPINTRKGLCNLASLTDITERKQLEDAMRASEVRFRSLFEQAPVSIQVFSPDGKTIAVNPAWKTLWGVDQDFVDHYILREYNILQDPQLVAKGIMPLINKAFQGEYGETPPILYDPAEIGKPGRARWASGFIYPIKDGTGRVHEVVLIHNDVTEREKTLRELEQAVRLRDDFLSIASHELKTPLTSLAMQIQLINRMAKQGTLANLSKDKASDLLKIAQEQLERFSTLINDLLDASRISAGKLTLNIEEIELSDLIHGVLTRFHDELARAECPVNVDVEPTIRGSWDRTRMEQIIINLLSNATKYGAKKPIEITARIDGDSVKITVQDHGTGVAQQDQARIFERFERAVSFKSFGGLGLGLYITRQIVEAHGGSIRVESEIGHGANFIVELPLMAHTNNTST